MLQKLTIRQKKLAEYLLIVAGTAVIAVSLQFFLDPDLKCADGSYCIKDQWMGLCKAHSGGITSPFFLACSDTVCAADGGT